MHVCASGVSGRSQGPAAHQLRIQEGEFLPFEFFFFPKLDAQQQHCKNETKELFIKLNRFSLTFEKLVNINTEAARLFGMLQQPLMEAQQRISAHQARCQSMRTTVTAFCNSVLDTVGQLGKLIVRTQKQPSSPRGPILAYLLAETESTEGKLASLWEEWRCMRPENGALFWLESLLREGLAEAVATRPVQDVHVRGSTGEMRSRQNNMRHGTRPGFAGLDGGQRAGACPFSSPSFCGNGRKAAEGMCEPFSWAFGGGPS